MGTRSLTHIKDSNNKTILTMYRQYDGYCSAHGLELAEFLNPIQLVNGFGRDTDTLKIANGSGCLAAQLVAHFKHDVGGFYLYPPNSKNCGEEYTYTIKVGDIETYNTDKQYVITVKDLENKRIFKGNLEQFTNFCKNSN
jgi:hypothetical protein